MRKITPLSALTLFLIVLVALCGTLVSPRIVSAEDTARVRVFHASPDAPNIDVTANGMSIASNLAYKAASDYKTLPATTHNIQIRAAGSAVTSTALLNQAVPLIAGVDYTLVALDRAGSLKLFVLEDRYAGAPSSGNFKARFVNAALDTPNVDVYVREAKTNAFTNVGFYNYAGYIQSTAGSYTLEVRPSGVITPLLVVPNHTDKAGTVVTSFLVGINGGSKGLEYVTIQDASPGAPPAPGSTPTQTPATGTATVTPTATSTVTSTGTLLRFVNASPDAPNVDVYLDGKPAASNIAFASSLGYMPVAPGSYNLDIRAAGSPVSGTTLLSTSIVVVTNTMYTATALDLAAHMRLLLTEDRPGADQAGMAQLRFINAAVNSPNLDLVATDSNTTIFSNLGFDNFSQYAYAAAGSPDLALRQNGITNTNLFAGKLTLNGSGRYTLMAIGNYSGPNTIKGIFLQDQVNAAPAQPPSQPTATPIPAAPVATATPATPSGQAHIAFLQASPDSASMDIYLASNRLVGELKYKQVTSYRTVNPGAYRVGVYAANADTSKAQPLFTSNVNLEAGKYYMIVVYDKAANLNAQLLVADLTKPAAGKAKVHIANYSTLAKDGLAVSNATLGSITIPFGGQSAYTAVPAGMESFAFKVAGATGNSTGIDLTLADGETYLLIALDSNGKVNLYGINERDTLIDVR